MKICFLCNEYPPAAQGGIGSFVQDLGRGLVKRGHHVIAAGVYAQPGLGEEYDNGVRIVRLARTPVGGRIGFGRDRLRLRREVNRLRRGLGLDLVEAPDTGGWGVAAPNGLPLVVRLHSPVRFGEKQGWRPPRGGLVTLAEDLALRRASRVVAVSHWMAKRALIDYSRAWLKLGRIEVVHNGVDTRLFKERSYDLRVPNRIVFAGSLKPQKGLVQLLRAFQRVIQGGHDLELMVAGKDTDVAGQPYRSAAIEEADLAEAVLRRINWLGPVTREDLRDLFASASACVFPSLAESFGLVAAEAMSCGRPVVYSKGTVGPEIIEDGVDGFLVDPEKPSDIGEAIIRIHANPEAAGLIGIRAARKVRENFSLQRCIDTSINLYQNVLGQIAGPELGDHGV